MFNRASPPFQQALQSSGYQHELSYNPLDITDNNNSRKRSRNIVWYNPPFSQNVTTNVGRAFLVAVNTEFPVGHKLRKIFNRNTVKVSYSCMSSIQQKINAHNTNILRRKEANIESNKTCNCRNAELCPLDKQCLTKSIIYQATVTIDNNRIAGKYVGLTEGTFKTRYANHKSSFKHIGKRQSTELSKLVWKLKEDNINFNITWRIVRRANSYSNISKKCSLCTWEKYYILYKPDICTLNRRIEILSTCRHAAKYLFKNAVT